MTESPLNPNNTRAAEFRYAYADTIGFQFNGMQTILTFSIARDPRDPSKGAQEQVAVAMIPSVAKSLVQTLGAILDHFEKIAGTPIPTNPQNVAAIEKAIKEADEQRKSAQSPAKG